MEKKKSLSQKQIIEENKKLKKQLEEKEKEIEYLHWYYNNELNKINFEKFLRLNYYYLKNYGILKYFGQVFKSFFGIFGMIWNKYKKIYKSKENVRTLKKILKENKNKKIFVFYPGYDWYMKMYQRPQHMAVHFSDNNILFFYCSANYNDNISGFKNIKENLYVTDQYNLLKEKLPKYTLYMCANVNGCYKDEMQEILKKGNNILYEYIDDLHEDLTYIPKELIKRHEWVLKKKNIPVIITANYLFEKAKKIRGNSKNLLLSTNGVVYEDFHITKKLPVPEKISKMVSEGKPIIGYYGALAKWFDYKLIIKIANTHPEWNILLIGINYDDSIKKYNYFKKFKNILYVGTVEYRELIKYGNCCNVLTIPFVINDITLATSPVKVFEYMSMEKPIVTTALPECRKYKSVMIGENHKDFIDKLEKALLMQNNKEYKNLLKQEALANTWDNKVKEILKFLKEINNEN